MHLRKNVFAAMVWIALCAVLMAALAPSISHLLAHRGESDAPFCHMPEHAMMHSSPAPGHLAHTMDMDDCGYCSMQGHLPVLPSVPPSAPLVIDLVRFAPPLFFLAPRPLFVWLNARSRAPPAR